jgi:hypothetical protein
MKSVCGPRHQASTSRLRGCAGRSFIFKQPEIHRLSIDAERGLPLTTGLVPCNASKPRTTGLTWAILGILRARRYSKVRAPVVEAISVDVVDFQAIPGRQPHDGPVQRNDASRTGASRQVPLGIAIRGELPAPLIGPRGGISIHDGVRMHGAITGSQGDADCPVRAGIIRAHRVPPVPCAMPGDGDNIARASCVNYTRFLRVEAS